MFDWVLNTPLVLTIKCHTLQSAPSEKQTFRKSGHYAKLAVLVKTCCNDKLEVADFKYENNLSLKFAA